MERQNPTTPPRPTVPVSPNAPKKTKLTYSKNTTKSSASRVLVLE
jgi:hypothetical protein